MEKTGRLLHPDDLIEEGARARDLASTVEGAKGVTEGVRLVNDAILAHILFALWDSGFYDYSLTHPRFRVQDAADELKLDESVLKWLLNHLVGRGVLRMAGDGLALTERGAAISSALVRGTLNLYLGGYGALLSELGPLLRKQQLVSDPALVRSQYHTGVGSEQMTCVNVVPAVLQTLARKGFRNVVDLGCGAGGFLIQLAHIEPAIRGLGIDMSKDAIEEARNNARRFHIEDRLGFVQAEIGPHPLPVEPHVLKEVEVITAMYLLHEFGRDGDDQIVEVFRQIRKALPGRLLLFVECFPADAQTLARIPPATFSQLDYLLIHPLSGQGVPLPPARWKTIVEKAGMKFLELQRIYWIGLYAAET